MNWAGHVNKGQTPLWGDLQVSASGTQVSGVGCPQVPGRAVELPMGLASQAMPREILVLPEMAPPIHALLVHTSLAVGTIMPRHSLHRHHKQLFIHSLNTRVHPLCARPWQGTQTEDTCVGR